MDFKPFKIGKYLLLERLATGGMAEVYRAKASGAGGFEKQLAIKRILPSYSENDEFRRMFEYEARLSSMLTHANIVQVYDFVKSGETYLLAMEYVDGKNLRQYVNKARKANISFPIEFSLFVMNEVCKGLEYAHKKKDDLTGKQLNIIHRDMSPQNIMLSYEGAVKIVDFGIAKAKDRADETRSGVIKGKFGYMSPEQANGEPVDHRTDIFSTGIIFYELLTGKRLFAAESDMATLRQIQDCIIPQPSRINPKITSDLERVMLKALAKDQTQRFQNAGLFHRAILEYLNKHYPAYTQREVGDLMQRTFAEEIQNEKKRFEQLYRQSIPFSQGAEKPASSGEEDELAGVEEALDGDVTRSEAGGNTAVTFVDEEISGADEPQPDFESGTKRSGSQGSATEPPGLPEPEVSSGGDTQVDALNSNENSTPTRGNNERTRVSGEIDTRKAGSLRKMDGGPPEPDRDDSVTPTQGGTKSRITRAGQTNNNLAAAGVILPGESAGGRRGGSYNNKLNETRVEGAPVRRDGIALESSFNRKREPQPDLVLSSNNPTSNSSGFELGGGVAPRERYRQEEELMPPPRRSLFSTPVKLFLAAAVVAGLYRMLMEGQVPTLVQMVQPRETTNMGARKPTDPPMPVQQNNSKPVGDCTLEITTDPLGALVSVGQQNVGPTPASVSGVCGNAVNITVQLDGYEAISENVVLKKTINKMYKTLKRLPLGTLELTVNTNAKVYLDDVYIGDATANAKFERSLRAKKYTMRLVNEVLGVETTDTVVINQDSVSRKTERLEARGARPPATTTRPRRK